MTRAIATFIYEDHGNDILEYAFLAGLLSLACFTALSAIGANISGLFNTLIAQFDTLLK